MIGTCVDAIIEQRPGGKNVIVSHLAESLSLLVRLRVVMLEELHRYDGRRRTLKRSGKRFPVARAFTREGVLQLLADVDRDLGT